MVINGKTCIPFNILSSVVSNTVNVEFPIYSTVKPVKNGHLKMDKTNVLTTNGSLMKIQSIAEHSLGAFCITFDLQ